MFTKVIKFFFLLYNSPPHITIVIDKYIHYKIYNIFNILLIKLSNIIFLKRHLKIILHIILNVLCLHTHLI